ncbi:hypothetical protein GCM10020220_036980 [Nonomuraea rubra]|uniref:hypothetical protein n=1 Tax=Nonomuraea rubra TaxID=46180 RepID=UPI0031F01856
MNTIDASGVRRRGFTFDRKTGSTPCLLMPYRSRLAISMLISAEFATANIEMNGSRSAIGKRGVAVCTTVASGVSLSARDRRRARTGHGAAMDTRY